MRFVPLRRNAKISIFWAIHSKTERKRLPLTVKKKHSNLLQRAEAFGNFRKVSTSKGNLVWFDRTFVRRAEWCFRFEGSDSIWIIHWLTFIWNSMTFLEKWTPKPKHKLWNPKRPKWKALKCRMSIRRKYFDNIDQIIFLCARNIRNFSGLNNPWNRSFKKC